MQKEDSVDHHLCLVNINDATDIDHFFDKSLQELRNFSSHLYQTAQYCESTFLAAEDKTIILEKTKQCISRAVVEVVEHFGSISANLESSLSSKTTSIPETSTKINFLKMRIEKCQQQSHKLTLDTFYLAADFSSRHHSRYILPPLTDLAASNVVSRISKDDIEVKTEKEDEFEPVRGDGLSLTLPKSEQPGVFQFKEARKAKRSAINWRVLHSKEMASLIRRGKRIIA